MARYKVILSYDGTDFLGFQRQSDVRTVQGVVEHALYHIGWQGQRILAAGRTDTGVHASGQVIAFDLDWVHSNSDLQRAMNANLPNDVAIKAIEVVNEDFHPRYDAQIRHYQYRIFSEESRQPLKERYAWRVWPGVNLDLMLAGAQNFLGTHDFAAFGSPTKRGGSTTRTIYQADWNKDTQDYVFDIQGNAFLYRMVRRILFFMVQIGQGKVDPDRISDKLQEELDAPVQGLAPSCGLNLVQVIYSSDD
jgi:tRNA pseudouridine38-40 synthase